MNNMRGSALGLAPNRAASASARPLTPRQQRVLEALADGVERNSYDLAVLLYPEQWSAVWALADDVRGVCASLVRRGAVTMRKRRRTHYYTRVDDTVTREAR